MGILESLNSEALGWCFSSIDLGIRLNIYNSFIFPQNRISGYSPLDSTECVSVTWRMQSCFGSSHVRLITWLRRCQLHFQSLLDPCLYPVVAFVAPSLFIFNDISRVYSQECFTFAYEVFLCVSGSPLPACMPTCPKAIPALHLNNSAMSPSPPSLLLK